MTTSRERINKNKETKILLPRKERQQGILHSSLSDLVWKINSVLKINNQSSAVIHMRSLNVYFFRVWKTCRQEILFNMLTSTLWQTTASIPILFGEKHTWKSSQNSHKLCSLKYGLKFQIASHVKTQATMK